MPAGHARDDGLVDAAFVDLATAAVRGALWQVSFWSRRGKRQTSGPGPGNSKKDTYPDKALVIPQGTKQAYLVVSWPNFRRDILHQGLVAQQIVAIGTRDLSPRLGDHVSADGLGDAGGTGLGHVEAVRCQVPAELGGVLGLCADDTFVEVRSRGDGGFLDPARVWEEGLVW